MNRIGHSYIFSRILVFFVAMTFPALPLLAQQAGGIRGMVYDKEFDAPLAGAQVSIAETGAKAVAADEGNYIFNQVEPGRYTLVFSKDGYTRQVSSDVVVSGGQMTDVNSSLSGEFTEMEEFVAQDLEIGGNSEEGLLNLRMESPALMDSVSSDLMSRAGAGDAASALNLVSGATVQDGKYAVVRGLPDRYVNSQINKVRLPTADPDKRAVQLDQFPSDLIESIQVSKTFTPDQQGDASGGAVNVVLKGIPDESVLKFSMGTKYYSQSAGDDFLTYDGGGVNFWGKDDGSRDIPEGTITPTDGLYFPGAVGVTRGEEPVPYDWTITAGNKFEALPGLTLGGLGTFYHKNDQSYSANGIDDSYWLTKENIIAGNNTLSPETSGDDPDDGGTAYTTSLFDVETATEEVQWGGLVSLGAEIEDHSVSAAYMYNNTAEDKATLAEDTRGKEYFDPDGIANPTSDNTGTAPYIRNETISYKERTADTLQFKGEHTLPFPEFGMDPVIRILRPELDWTVAKSSSALLEPDKRLLSHTWSRGYTPMIDDPTYNYRTQWNTHNPPWYHPSRNPGGYRPQIAGMPQPSFYSGNAAGEQLGNFQRIWKEVLEESDQYFLNAKLPFENWSGKKGYLKGGVFNDKVNRSFDQETFSNKNADNPNAPPSFEGEWEDSVSDIFYAQHYTNYAADVDVDYDAEQEISAWYYMVDFPLFSFFKVLGGARYETTELTTDMKPDIGARKLVLGAAGPIEVNPATDNADFSQDDVLPMLGFEFSPLEPVTLHGSYTETVARQTFKELVPIAQREYLGGDVFSGNPDLQMSSVKNYDLRLDYVPYSGSLLSASWFKKKITDPIEYVQGYANQVFTTPVNFPKGQMTGYEFEIRQHLGQFLSSLEGLNIGGNLTLISAEVTQDEASGLTRDMLETPEYLYNVNFTYDIRDWGTRMGLFYTVRGDALVAGSGQADGNFIPNVYAKEYGTLNFSLSQKIREHWTVSFKAKNLLNPEIQEVYRFDEEQGGGETLKTSYTKGIEYSISASYEF